MTQEEYSEYLELKNAVKQKDNIISNLNGQIKNLLISDLLLVTLQIQLIK